MPHNTHIAENSNHPGRLTTTRNHSRRVRLPQQTGRVQLVTIDDIHAAADRIRDVVVSGAFNALACLDESVRARGVVAYPSGNHAQAVAYAAAAFGVPAHIVMPEETPNIKVQATRNHRADVVLCGRGQREKSRRRSSRRRVRCWCRRSTTAEGLRVGHRVDWSVDDRNTTIADGLRSQPSELTFAHLQKVLEGVITVSEDEIRAAVRELAYRAHLVAEPSGAVGLAAYRQGSTPAGRTAIILSGENIDAQLLREILAG
jgi:threonine dehydratase